MGKWHHDGTIFLWEAMDSHGYPKPIEIGQHLCYIMAIMALYVTLWHHFFMGEIWIAETLNLWPYFNRYWGWLDGWLKLLG